MTATYVEAQLRVTYQRIYESIARLSSAEEDEAQWLATCFAREALVDATTPDAWMFRHLGLTASESRTLWVLIAHELNPTARLQLRELATETEVDVTLDVIRRVVYGASPSLAVWRELSAAGRLRRDCLIEATGSDQVPAHRVALRLAPRVLALVHGDVSIDDELAPLLVRKSELVRPAEELSIDTEVMSGARASMSKSAGFTVIVGPTGTGRRSLLQAVSREQGREMLVIDARQVSPDKTRADRQARIFARECRLLRRRPLILNLEALESGDNVPDRLDVFEAALETATYATASRIVARRWRVPVRTLEMATLAGVQRAQLWQRALPQNAAVNPDQLSTLYPLAPAMISSVGAAATEASGAEPVGPDHICTGIRAVLDDRLAGLARRVSTSQTWDDLILPDDQSLAVVELLARIRARRRVYEDWGFADKVGKGLGVAALFSGPPGTGKTMCAGLIAKDLGTEIYQVEMSKIVSKWVGETEKNLAALFDAAEACHAVLLFDEADSLFGKRTSTVASSNDRYANQETNFLLQRLESFAGICILTTNHEPAIDEAFKRRLAVHLRFPLPDEGERRNLWKAMLPKRAPVEPRLDLESLAKNFVMGGGNIRNAVLRAAFLAADANENIGSYHLQQAAQLEYEAMGKLGGR